MVDNLLPEHVELPHVLDLAVHLVQLTTWMGRGGHTETFSLFELWGLGWGCGWCGVWGGGPCDFIVTPVPIGLGF